MIVQFCIVSVIHTHTHTHTHLRTVVLYAVTAVYFAGVMVRLMLTLTPIVVILASITISHTLDNYMKPVFSQNKDGETINGIIHLRVHVHVAAWLFLG